MALNPDEIGESMVRLINTHPLLFRGKAPAVLGFIPDGWYALVDKVCFDIEAALGSASCADFEVRQIKEKFGTLRFYFRYQEESDLHISLISGSGEEYITQPVEGAEVGRVRELIALATDESELTCQRCGAAGVLRNLGGWHVTLCEPHAQDRMKGRQS